MDDYMNGYMGNYFKLFYYFLLFIEKTLIPL